MKFLERLRKLPEGKRKIIFWFVLFFLAIIIGFFYIKNAQKNFKELKKIDFQKKFEEQIKNLPRFELPQTETSTSTSFETMEEEFKKLEEEFKKLEGELKNNE